jgi:hypothetical protein
MIPSGPTAHEAYAALVDALHAVNVRLGKVALRDAREALFDAIGREKESLTLSCRLMGRIHFDPARLEELARLEKALRVIDFCLEHETRFNAWVNGLLPRKRPAA